MRLRGTAPRGTAPRGTARKRRRTLRALPALLLLGLIVSALAGCASVRERQSFDEYYREEERSYPGEEVSPPVEPAAIGEDAGLPDLLVYAALHNPGLEAAFDDWKAALERIPQMRSLPDPRFTYVYYIETVETRVGPQQESFAVAQTFPWLGKLRRQGDAAVEAAEAAHQRYEAAKLALFCRVNQAYYEYYYLERSLAVTDDNIKLVSNLEAVARTRYQTGMAPYSAVVKAQVELGKLEDQVETLRDLRVPTAARVNAALGRAPGAYLPAPRSPGAESAAVSDTAALGRLRENNPELLALGRMTAKEEAAVSLAGQAYVPDITLGAAVIQTGDAMNPGVEDSGKDPVMASLSLNLPIWFGKYRAAKREAEARQRANAKRRQQRENELITDLKTALFNFHSAERRIDLYGDSLLPKAEASLSASQAAFAAGQADFLDVIEAQRTLLEFQLAYERALTDRAQRLAEIEMITGGGYDNE
jgi:cobalt-zinc-cadmium efflux system outer membrane protein